MSTVDNRSGFRKALNVLLLPAILLVVFVVLLLIRGF